MSCLKSIGFILFCFVSSASLSQELVESKPYTISVWLDVAFDENAKIKSIAVVDKEKFSEPFVLGVTNKVSKTAFVTPDNSASFKTLETGLKTTIEINPTNSDARFISEETMPRPSQAENLGEPEVRIRGEWNGRVFVRWITHY